MPWHEYTGEEKDKAKSDRSFLHGILIGGFLAAIVFGVTFGTLYGDLLKQCGL